MDAFAANAFEDRRPLGVALMDHYKELVARFSAYDLALLGTRPDANAVITDILIARDIQRSVLLGDPAVVLPAIQAGTAG